MLFLFRNSRFSTFFPLALYALLLHAPALLRWHELPADDAATGGVWYEKLVAPYAAGVPGVSAGLALFLVLVLALSVNRLADRFRLLGERNWFPGLGVVLVASSAPWFLLASPALVASAFVAPALVRLFSAYNAPAATAIAFDTAFWIAVGSLFHPALLWLLPAAFAGLSVVRAFGMREQLVFVSGAVVPLFLAWLGYFWYDAGLYFVDRQFGVPFGFGLPKVALSPFWAYAVGLPLLAVLFSGAFYRRKLIQIQKYISVLYWFLLFGGVGVALLANIRQTDFLIVAPPLGIFAAYWLHQTRKPWLAEAVHLVWLALVVLLHAWR